MWKHRPSSSSTNNPRRIRGAWRDMLKDANAQQAADEQPQQAADEQPQQAQAQEEE